jgi:hypothetical protein
MATNLVDRAWMNVSGTPGTGNITLGSVVAGNQSFSDAGVTDGVPFSYVAIDGNDFEIGTGQSASSVTTWQRTTVARSVVGGTAGTSKLNLSSAAQIFLTARAVDLADASLFKTGTVAAARLPLGTSANQVPQLDGSGHLLNAVMGASSIISSGYYTLPGGLMIQWGRDSVGTGGLTKTLPTAFPTAGLVGFAAFNGAVGNNATYVSNVTTTSIVLGQTTGVTASLYWVALGY